jgi:hypothetical protein
MKILTIITTLLLFTVSNSYGNFPFGNSKNEKTVISPDETKAFAVAGINSGGKLNDQILDNLKRINLPDTYFHINFSDTELSMINLNQINSATISTQRENELQNWLNTNKTGQDILAHWFNRQPDGSFCTKFLKNSGLINESLAENLTKKETANKETATLLANSPLNETYLLVFDFSSVQTMDDYYDKNNINLQNRIQRGYIASVKTYIFKLDFNNSVAETFLNNHFATEDNEAAQTKQVNFDQSEFPFFFVTAREDEIASVQPKSNQEITPADIKSDKELLDAMGQLAVENITNLVDEGKLTLSVKKLVKSTKPVTAHIGNAQNVKFDQRFGVYKNQITSSGQVKAKRVSVVKSMKVADTKNKSDGENDYSAFYKIAGGKVNGNEMFLKKKYDTGINLFAGKTMNGMSGNTGRFEYYFSKAMGGAVLPGKKAKGLTSIKLYFEAAQNKKSYLLFDKAEDFTFTRGSFGIEKEYHPLPFMHWGPFIGYGLEYTTWENSGDLLSSNFAEFGARLGINLRHNIQVIGSATYYHLIKTVLMDDNRDVLDPDFDYKSTFNDRGGWGYTIGLRIML